MNMLREYAKNCVGNALNWCTAVFLLIIIFYHILFPFIPVLDYIELKFIHSISYIAYILK